ncbi:ZIP family metal transporter [Halosegnis marinus]|uniref:ZIP family metal transporter n=1 Tax=Halosegnis marinus TaxID=3034023 RepID=A0ABD5ZNP5_9EURY|nr:ZIP family metal transporter [Halosegnis sp. DT85]
MAALDAYVLVFAAGLVTALATGLGALPFFVVREVSDRLNVVLWGVASGIMLVASAFGLVPEGLATGSPTMVVAGLLAGVVLVVVAHDYLADADIDPKEYEEADFRKLVLILGVLTVHSFPEGIAIGVSFAELNLTTGLALFGFTVPALAVAMTVAISVHNVPEGVAISIPLRDMGQSPWRMVGWSVFSSLPQPIGAVIAFGFVRLAAPVLPFGFGFAAGAMAYLVVSEFVPEALSAGADLAGDGYRELAAGIGGGGAGMALLLVLV